MHKRNMLDVFFVSTFLLSVLMINVSKVEAAETTVSVQPSSQTVGQEGVLLPTPPFAINITVQDVEDLYAWQIFMYYNSTILSTRPDLIIVPPENIFKGKDYLPIGPYIEVDSKGTYIYFGATLWGEVPGVTGSGVLCQINFTGQATGTSELNLGKTTQHGGYTKLASPGIGDAPAEEIPSSKVDGQVTVIGIEDPRRKNTITIHVKPSTVNVTSNVTITGTIRTINQTNVGVVNVTIHYKPLLGTTGTLATVQTNESSSYEYNWTTEEAGEYTLFASWPGDDFYRPATSNSEPVTVNKWSSTISLNVYPIKVDVGSSVIINGTIITSKPTLHYENVTISYKRKGREWATLATVYPGEDGFYTYTWETNEGGLYNLKAEWPGDKYSDSAYSVELTVEVIGESMAYLYYIIAAIAIIAIATIGIYFTKIRKRQHAADK